MAGLFVWRLSTVAPALRKGMQAKSLFLAAALLAAMSAQASAQATQSGGTLFEDRQQDIQVRYAFTTGAVEFSAYLPLGWTFRVEIDGDQNGAWGNGPGEGVPDRSTSGDRAFGQDSNNGVFCAQYILTTRPGQPEQVYMSSECSGYPSRGRVEMSQLDERRRATITYRIPSAEVFDTHREARLRACVYNGQRWICQHSLARLVVVRNPNGGSAE